MRQEIIVQNLTVGYRPGVPVLRDVGVTVQPGQILALTGSSGAGKTTLLRTMAGLLKPTGGSVLIGGSAVRNRDHAVQLRVAPRRSEPRVAAGQKVITGQRLADLPTHRKISTPVLLWSRLFRRSHNRTGVDFLHTVQKPASR